MGRRSALHSIAFVYFEAVARLGSVRGAAEELFVSASAVSHQINLLEEELATPLFVRLHRGVALSSAGETLLYHARRGAAEFERGRAFVDRLKGLNSGATSLATTEGLAAGPIADMLHGFWLRYPGIHVDLLSRHSGAVFTAVEASQSELGLAYNVDSTPKVKVLAKAQLRIGAILRSDHELARKKSVSLHELSATGTPILLVDSSISTRPILERAIGKDAMRSLRRLTTNSTMVINRLAMGGMGVAIKSRVGIAGPLQDGSVSFVPIRELEATRESLVLFSRLGAPLTPAGTALCEALEPVVAALDE